MSNLAYSYVLQSLQGGPADNEVLNCPLLLLLLLSLLLSRPQGRPVCHRSGHAALAEDCGSSV
jgi:hypothetical protein